jgi:hypothetical protein
MVRAVSASLCELRLPLKSPLDAGADASKKSVSKPISHFKLGFFGQYCGDLPMQIGFQQVCDHRFCRRA